MSEPTATDGPREVLRLYAPLAVGGWIALTAVNLYALMTGDMTAALIVLLCTTFWVPACIIGIVVEMRRAWLGGSETRAEVEVPMGKILAGVFTLLSVCVAAFVLIPAVVYGLD